MKMSKDEYSYYIDQYKAYNHIKHWVNAGELNIKRKMLLEIKRWYWYLHVMKQSPDRSFCILIELVLEFVCLLVFGTKLLPWAVLTKFNDVIWRHWPSKINVNKGLSLTMKPVAIIVKPVN